ncbi:Protein-S-isoprenylcysteine O-methyltransferase Ste14 [Enhydrobacter aerosaccus]|uniref:Protein-S-isoprenylcysteine O-methyltransferase Ste14 n=1 Tax=Enhydrobacter aerosaccus TaxID=225324 RepID=A0A1T4RZJ5_9HYPH|nr:isoprenylcysteine carboxylmethyltransferase family protein [Enhydrobacter aerosaccus]SKA20981.1 Protein-S-isoprenylcysteine O-methyltransferase Ste14 [Enhydrobacter aerosaccus]
MNTLAGKALQGLVGLFLAMAALLFGLPWTIDYWQAWLFLFVYFLAALLISLSLLEKDPELLRRRMRAGPLAEKEPKQKIIMLFASIGFAGLLIIPALDRRFGWSHVPTAAAIAGDLLVLLGWIAIYRVFRENSFTSATIEVASDQRVISTGPYGMVRHPMYAASLVMLVGIPIALASWWGLLSFGVIAAALAWRILDEERFLVLNLRGYADYKQKVRYRLIPHLW